MIGDRPDVGLAAAARCLALDQSAVKVVRLLGDHQIPSVLLKGAGLARRLYPDPSRRHYSDVDLLVSPDDFGRTQQVLTHGGYRDAAAGYRADELLWHEHPWLTPGRAPLSVDLHRGFAGVGDPLGFWRAIFSGAESMPLSGAEVLVPNAAGCALVTALHAAADGPGRRAATDLRQALGGSITVEEWTAAATLARDTGSAHSFAVGLQSDPGGALLASRLEVESHRTARELLKDFGAQPLTHSLALLQTYGGLTAKVRHIARRALPSRASMRRSMHKDGRRSLVGAYVRRLVRLAKEMPAAQKEFRRLIAGPSQPRQPRHSSFRSAVRLLPRVTTADIRSVGWTWWALHQVRRQLNRQTQLDHVRLTRPPRVCGARAGSMVRRTLDARGANCLQRSLVLQRWAGARQRSLDLVIGVTNPSSGFHAHAWLEPPAGTDPSSTEIYRRPMPAGWLASD